MTDGSSATKRSVIEIKRYIKKSHTQRVLGVGAVVSTSVVTRVTTGVAARGVVRGGACSCSHGRGTGTGTSIVVVVIIARATPVVRAIVAPIVATDFEGRSLHCEDHGGEEECDGGLHIFIDRKKRV
jgi:hypothetical protein